MAAAGAAVASTRRASYYLLCGASSRIGGALLNGTTTLQAFPFLHDELSLHKAPELSCALARFTGVALSAMSVRCVCNVLAKGLKAMTGATQLGYTVLALGLRKYVWNQSGREAEHHQERERH